MFIWARDNPGRRLRSIEKALPVLQQAGAKQEEVNTLAGLGGAYSTLSRFDKAAEILEQALSIARQSKNRQGESAILNNLGQTYENLGKYDEAMSAFNQALQINREIKDRPGESACLSNLGICLYEPRATQRSRKIYEAALAISREIKDRSGEASGLGDLGVASVAQGEYPERGRLPGAGLGDFSRTWQRGRRSLRAEQSQRGVRKAGSIRKAICGS